MLDVDEKIRVKNNLVLLILGLLGQMHLQNFCIFHQNFAWISVHKRSLIILVRVLL